MSEIAKKAGTYKRIIVIALFLLYLSCLFYLTFFSQLYGRGYFHRSMNLIPLETIRMFIASGHIRGILVNVFGNIAAFVPMGLLLPVAFKKSARLYRTLITTLGVSLMIEIVQYTFGVGAADVDDLMLNLAGGLTGYLVFAAGRALYRHIARSRHTIAE